MSKVWFVTGSSRGIGREIVQAALSRGDRVAASARNPETLKDLVDEYGDAILALELDVTDRDRAFEAIAEAHEQFGRLDVIVNNAGYGLFGAFEEVSEQDFRDVLEANLFGSFHVTRAAIPVLREQGSGHIVQISSGAGLVNFPAFGAYNASKFAVEGLFGELASEIEQFGIKVTIVEPGAYDTEAPTTAAKRSKQLPYYDRVREMLAEQSAAATLNDPAAAGAAMLELVDLPEPPRRVLFGKDVLSMAQQVYADRLVEWQRWADFGERAG
ncbi:SDR family NAD(P)-dependent oxidoreductase [Nocardia iowensis]|uniref:SDR family NAD(P)-dependent oxidoreductase n=1 Tax=Nocardia iowensis TaxID=204891 RepID=A0ABX8S1J9_NOCIO|nr:SDR family NAD(P)-dependent oxidoreductase [Nocardia iowensis]QXN94939.1 SDR family NAD(P)-dependent oxidoreductase [Nocardia iowensis]